jgi:DNA-binding response OmpR family regulator
MSAKILLDRFEHAGVSVVHAQNGIEGIEFFKKFSPDVVILDQIMPEMNGIGVLQVIREEIGDTTTPIIMLTALGQVDLMMKALSSGASDFLVKGGVSSCEILDRVTFLLKKIPDTEE